MHQDNILSFTSVFKQKLNLSDQYAAFSYYFEMLFTMFIMYVDSQKETKITCRKLETYLSNN